MRRAWIEIVFFSVNAVESASSLSVRRAWIEITAVLAGVLSLLSLSVRRAWIEILS